MSEQWISVAERVPEPGKAVLVFALGCNNIDMLFAAYSVRGFWVAFGTGTLNVSHWMPLPEPPEEPTDAN